MPRASKATAKRTTHVIVSTLLSLLVMIVILGVAAIIFFQWQLAMTTIPSAKDIPLPQEIMVVDSTGGKLGELTAQEGNRKIVPASAIAPTMMDAIVAAEDRSFWDNDGYDVKGIVRAAFGHLTGDPNAGGGSTITQQYIKNSIGSDDYTLARKWNELLLSVKMSREWKKRDILTNYLNTIYFGRGAYGVEKASWAYFGKSAKTLTYPEAALLAGAVQRPSVLDPHVNREATVNRWTYVMQSLNTMGKISDGFMKASEFPHVIEYNPKDGRVGPNGHIIAQVSRELEENGWSHERLSSSGVTRVVTTIDGRVQKEAIASARRFMSTEKKLRAAIVSIDPTTGAVRGYYGGDNGLGFDYANSGQMTGSTFKTFALAAALDQDIPLYGRTFSADVYKAPGVTVRNVSSGCNPCTMAQATLYSLNTSFYRIQDALSNGPKDTARMAYAAGIPRTMPITGEPTLQEKNGTVYPGIVLGQYKTRPIDMASAYGTFAASGMYSEPFFVDRVMRDKKELYKHKVKHQQRIRKNVADDVTEALTPVAAYSNNHGLADGRVSASKTGTVQLGDTGANRDAWMVGYTPSLSTAVWVGTDNGVPLTYQGASVWGATVPSDMWKSVMDAGHKGKKREVFVEPVPQVNQAPVVPQKKTPVRKHRTPAPRRQPSPQPHVPEYNPSGNDPINDVLNTIFGQG